MKPGSRDMTWPYLVSGFSKFDINAHNVWHSCSNSIKLYFWIAALKTFQTTNILFSFDEAQATRSALSHCLSLWRHFWSRDFQICIFCRTLNGLSACKVSMLQVVFGTFYRQIDKRQNDGIIMTSFQAFGIWKSLILQNLIYAIIPPSFKSLSSLYRILCRLV